MPTYDYECLKCRRAFDACQKISARPKAACPKCGSSNTRRVFSAPNFILKGSGFYVNDSKSKPAAAPSKPPKDSGKAETKKPAENKAAKSP